MMEIQVEMVLLARMVKTDKLVLLEVMERLGGM